MRCLRAAVLAALAACSASAHALEVDAIDVRVTEHGYRVQFEAVLAAPVERVVRVLTDYPGYASLDPRIRASEVLGATEAGDVLVRTRIRACAMLFCRTVTRTERVTRQPGRLVAEVLPASSDIRHGFARTEWHGETGRTRIRYEAEFEPAFWVPGIVARHYAGGALRESVLSMFENVEERARER